MKNICNMKITNVSQFISVIGNFQLNPDDNKKNFTLFYRGHADESWKVEPSAYRNLNKNRYLEMEFRGYQEMLCRSPGEFCNDKTVFENLIRMQHYGLPTRLLDLTENSLVALYFACEAYKNKDGAVLLFKRNPEQIYYIPSIPETAFLGLSEELNIMEFIHDLQRTFVVEMMGISKIKSGIVEVDERLQNKIDALINMFHRYTRDLKYFFTNAEDLKKILNGFLNFNDIDTALGDIEIDDKSRKNVGDVFLQIKRRYEKFFIDQCKAYKFDKSYVMGLWCDCYINFLKKYKEIYFVKPPLNNERISRQQGAFMIFSPFQPFSESSVEPDIKIIVSKKKKEYIRKELECMGIAKRYLFPELDVQAQEIRRSIYNR